MKIKDIVPVALGKQQADVLLKNGKIVNVYSGKVEEANIALFRKRIAGVGDYTEGKEIIDLKGLYVVPGFIDGHLHIESSMTSPREFARAVLSKGTTTIIADPHEITNVLGLRGLQYMIESTEGIPLNVYIAIPSAVPSTSLETSGDRLGPEDMVSFIDKYPRRIIALGEVMNYPGVLNRDNELITKIEILRHEYKKIDGHAPGLTGKELNAYIDGFIRSDHESTTAEEAYEKVSRGMQVLIREGTAAKNLEALVKAVDSSNCRFFSFCTDDREPADIIREGHIDFLIKKAIRLGLDPITAIRMATINTATHYNLRSMGAIAPGYKADMVVIDDLKNLNIKMVIKDSRVVAENEQMVAPLTGLHEDLPEVLGKVNLPDFSGADFKIPAGSRKIRVIGMRLGDLYTDSLVMDARIEEGSAVADPEGDLVKVLVFDRHQGKHISKAFAKGFGIKRGALATTIGHDAHNLCVMGVDDKDMFIATKRVQELNGGIVSVIDRKIEAELALPIAGLMSDKLLDRVVKELEEIKKAIHRMGSRGDILMIFHFIQLAVIPELKLTDRGLVNVAEQRFVELFV
ncbi:MAG: adenine deaminase [Spirochaetes bacterium]|nr:MAG: adenine deaminase [Spirochaetota bacterium]